MTVEVPYRQLPLEQSEVRYAHGPASVVQQGVPAGETIEFDWRDSNAYPGTRLANSGFMFLRSMTRRSQRR